MFEQGDVKVVVDRTTSFYIDEPLKIDYENGAYRIRAASHVIPDRIKL